MRLPAASIAATRQLLLLAVLWTTLVSFPCSAEEVEISASGDTWKVNSDSASDTIDPHVMRARAIFEWVNAHKNGYMNLEAQIIQKIDGNMGVFASQDIPKNTVLARIPFELFIKSDNPKDSGQLPCGTGKMDEHRK